MALDLAIATHSEGRRLAAVWGDQVYIVLSYVTYALLAVFVSLLLFGLGAVVVIVEEAFRFARAHEARHETVRRHRTGR